MEGILTVVNVINGGGRYINGCECNKPAVVEGIYFLSPLHDKYNNTVLNGK